MKCAKIFVFSLDYNNQLVKLFNPPLLLEAKFVSIFAQEAFGKQSDEFFHLRVFNPNAKTRYLKIQEISKYMNLTKKKEFIQ